jgi:hypothetical protein
LGLFEHPAVELQPTRLPIEEVFAREGIGLNHEKLDGGGKAVGGRRFPSADRLILARNSPRRSGAGEAGLRRDPRRRRMRPVLLL